MKLTLFAATLCVLCTQLTAEGYAVPSHERSADQTVDHSARDKAYVASVESKHISDPIVFEDRITTLPIVSDGFHTFAVRIFANNHAIYVDTLQSVVEHQAYALLLGGHHNLMIRDSDELLVEVTIDKREPTRTALCIRPTAETPESLDATPMHGFGSPLSMHSTSILHGLQKLSVTLSFASPESISSSTYENAKYGRIAIDYPAAFTFNREAIGVSGQALHVAHHLLFYSAGFTMDVNNDNRFVVTMGLAHYQSGNDKSEPFVNAPYVWLRYNGSQAFLFPYAELEATVHYRGYLSGTAGLGMRITETLSVITGVHHTEFYMPTENQTREVNGFHGMLRWNMP